MQITYLLLLALPPLLLASDRSNSTADAQENIILVTEITRHGTRSSLRNWLNPSWLKYYGLAELTVPGYRQHWILGKNIKEKYPTIFDHLFTQDELWARSTGFNRCVQSANAHLEGIFEDFKTFNSPFANDDPRQLPPWEHSTFNLSDIKFKTALPQKYNPYAVMTPYDGINDPFLKADEMKACPGLWPLRDVAANDFAKYINSSQQLQETASTSFYKYNMTDDDNFVGKYGFNITSAFLIVDTLLTDYANSAKPYLDIKNNEDDYKLWMNSNKVYSMAIYQFYNSTQYLRSVVTPIQENLRQNINHKAAVALGEEPAAIQNPNPALQYFGEVKYNSMLRYILLSAHDSTLAQILIVIGHIDPTCLINEFMSGAEGNCQLITDPSATVVWELAERKKGDIIVRFHYNNNYLNFCNLDENTASKKYDCDQKRFNEVIDKIVIPNFKEACSGNYNSAEEATALIQNHKDQFVYQLLSVLFFCLVGVIILFAIIAITKIFVIRNRKKPFDCHLLNKNSVKYLFD